MRTRIKMCGMTRAEDIRIACEFGADAIGMVFYDPSPRSVSLSIASQLSVAVTAFVDKVALFVDADEGFIKEVLNETQADIIQFHGNESVDFCEQFGVRYIKALRVKSSDQVTDALSRFTQADALLLDAFVEGVPGGTGQSFDWAMIPNDHRHKIILAGGLNPNNVGNAIRMIQPYAVDVSGGIEQSKGVKSKEKIKQFAFAAYEADNAVREISS